MRLLFLLVAFLVTLFPTTTVQAGHHPHHVRIVECWYRHHLGRSVDCLGATVWCGQLNGGVPGDLVLAQILGSSEYYCKHGKTPCGFIKGLYVEVVARPPCAQELIYWKTRLRLCGCRIRLATEFLCAFRKGLLRKAPVVPTVQPPPVSPPPVVPPPPSKTPTLPPPKPVPSSGRPTPPDYYPPVPGS